MAITDSYDIYSLSGTGNRLHPFTLDASLNPILISQIVYDTNIAGNSQVLDDVAFDSLAEHSQTLGCLLHSGLVTYKLLGNTTEQAVIGETRNDNFKMFVNAGTPPPSTLDTLTFTKNVFSNGVT